MTAIQSALTGMNEAESQLDSTASRIARLPFPNTAPQDTVDLSQEMVNLIQSRNDFAGNTKVAQTADEIQQSTLSILA